MDPANQPRMVASNLPIGRVVRGEPVVHVFDLMAGDLTHEPPAARKLVELGGFRTILALPLRNDAALLVLRHRRKIHSGAIGEGAQPPKRPE